MRTTVELPDPLFRVAKALAAEKGISLKDFFTEALKKAVNNPKTHGKRMERPPIGSTQGKRIPARTNAELNTILQEEELGKAR
jgi:hypothetical protein